MELNKAIEKRRSTRSFKDKKINFKYLIEAIDAANKAPHAGGFYSIRFLIIENPKTINKIAHLAEQHWISQAPALILVCSDERNLENLYGERGRIYARQQAGASTENLILTLTDLGLSSCWVGAFSDEIIREAIGIPGHINIEAIIPVGYEKPEKTKKKITERKLENSMFWEKWDQRRRPTSFEEDLLGDNPPVKHKVK